jgi:hypothetical protein
MLAPPSPTTATRPWPPTFSLGAPVPYGPHHQRLSFLLRRPQDPLDGGPIHLLFAARVRFHGGEDADGDFFFEMSGGVGMRIGGGVEERSRLNSSACARGPH